MRLVTEHDLPAAPNGKSGWPWTTTVADVPPTLPDGAPWPRVTVVTPSFNQAPFLEETIRSVLLQGYPNLEYLIIDGGSTDGSLEIIKKYEPWLAYWVSEPDNGQSQAINKGFRRATGDVLAWLNSDDFYYPRAIVTAVEALHASPEVGFVHSEYDVVDRQSRHIRRIDEFARTVVELVEYGGTIGQPTVFMRRSALEQVGFLREDLYMIMDFELWVRLMRGFPAKYLVGVQLAVARHYPAAKSTASEHRRIPELMRVLDDLYREPELEDSIRAVKRLAYGRAFMYFATVEANRKRAFPAGLMWYGKALVFRPRYALKFRLAPLWFLREALRQLGRQARMRVAR